MSVRLILALLIAVALAGCDQQALLGRGVGVVTGAAESNDTPEPVATAQGEFLPRFAVLLEDTARPVLLVNVDSRDQSGKLILESVSNGVETWLSADIATLIMEQGMIQGTRSIGSELMASDIAQPKALVLAGRAGTSDRFASYLTGNDRIVTRTYRCRVEIEGYGEITLETGPVQTRIMSEDCKSLDQSFRNSYWVSTQTGRIVKAREWTGEKLGYLTTQVSTR